MTEPSKPREETAPTPKSRLVEGEDKAGARRPDYSDIFGRLVAGRDDIEGLIAYGFYKFSKQEWVVAECPSDEDRRRYHRKVTEHELNGYRAQARELLSKAFIEIQDETIERLRDQVLHERTIQEVKAIESSTLREISKLNGFWRGVGSNFIATLPIGAFLLAVYVISLTPTLEEFLRRVMES